MFIECGVFVTLSVVCFMSAVPVRSSPPQLRWPMVDDTHMFTSTSEVPTAIVLLLTVQRRKSAEVPSRKHIKALRPQRTFSAQTSPSNS